MTLSFLQPGMGLLLLAVPLIWFLPARRPRSATQAALRTLILALAILALMQPVLVTSTQRQHYALVLDQSASVPAPARARGIAAARALAEQADGADVTLLQLGGEESALDGEGALWLRPGAQDASPLGDALALAAQSIPHRTGGAVTLISDGAATDRHWGKALSHLADRRIPVHVLPLPSHGDPFLARIESSPARPGESMRVAVHVAGTGTDLAVVLRAGDRTLAKSAPFASRGRQVLEMDVDAAPAGFLEFEAELTSPPGVDDDAGNNLGRGVLVVRDPVRVLYAGERQQGAREHLAALLGDGFEMTAATGAQLAEGFDFAGYDLAMLDDIPARSLPPSAQRRLIAATRNDGLGLLATGGAAAFADGGYHGSPLAEVLPVSLTGEEDKIDPSVGLAIIIDTSGSMGGTRIELAKQIARIAVRRMQPHDRLGIVEFYGAKHWAVPMQPASNKIEIDRAIGRMKAIGGTVLYPAIQEAYYGLKNVNTRYKHILLITDAGVEDSNYERMLRRIAKDAINVSTVLVGQGGHNLIMSDIANWGRGRFYAVGNQFSLVELILKQPATRKPPRYRQGVFEVQALGGPGWWGRAGGAVPALTGYVEVEARDGAEVLLETRDGQPLLASWRYGLGRVTALMTEPAGAGTVRWRDWPDYGEFLGRVAGRTAADHQPFGLTLARRRGTLTLTAQRNVRDAALRPTAHLIGAAGERLADRPVAFRESAPGLFEALIDAPRDETVRVAVQALGRTQRIAAAGGSDAAAETQVDPWAALDLAQTAVRTGGTQLSAAGSNTLLPRGAGESSLAATRLWPFLLLAALLAYLAELAYRRWPRSP